MNTPDMDSPPAIYECHECGALFRYQADLDAHFSAQVGRKGKLGAKNYVLGVIIGVALGLWLFG